jgi:hypothetical protein
MVAFNFMARVADQVEQGLKPSTIRAERKDGRPPCKVGDALQLYTGMRSKSCRKLRDTVCKRIRRLEIKRGASPFSGFNVYIDGRYRPRPHALAKQDGFASAGDMIKFFDDVHGLPFTGWLIEW